MSLYELTFILRQDIANSEVKKFTDKLISIVKEGEGKLLKSEYWGLRNLAYPIKKNKKGHYTMLIFELSKSEALKELKRAMFLSEDVVRDLLMRIKAFDKKNSIMMQKEENDI